jgi:plastocyanin
MFVPMALAVMALTSCGSTYGRGTKTSSAPADAASIAGSTAGAIAIKNSAFTPSDITVAMGTTVTWTNEDGVPHRIKSADGTFDGKDLSKGATFEHKFDKAGTFSYVCGIHLRMTGKVVVT